MNAYTVHCVHSTLYTVHTVCTVHCTLYTVHCTLCTVHCTLYVHPLYVGCMLSGYCPLAVGCRGTSCTVHHLLYTLSLTVQLFLLILTVGPGKGEASQACGQAKTAQLCQAKTTQLVLPRLVARQKLHS